MKNCPQADIFNGVGRVGFLGLGRSNLAILSMLSTFEKRPEVVLRQDGEHAVGSAEPRGGISLPTGITVAREYYGGSALDNIDEDMLILSPSVRRDRPELIEAVKRGVKLTSDAELFFEHCNRPVIAVSGSDGKSTTVAMTAAMLGGRAALVGNIGVPMLSRLTEALPEIFVCELSSFMLQYYAPRSLRAAITNITPNHLNWHRDFSEYSAAKLSLLQSTLGAVVNADDTILSSFARGKSLRAVTSSLHSAEELMREYTAEVYLTHEDGDIFLNGRPYIRSSGIALPERHNLKNLMTAIGLCYGIATDGDIIKCARDFKGLPHRCERFYTAHGIDFINSSIDTTPLRTSETLASVGRGVVLILGGRGKGLSYSLLEEPIRTRAVAVAVYGEDREKIAVELSDLDDRLFLFDDARSAFVGAIELALRLSARAVLLSPAATSYDCFSSFEERGECFMSTVKKYFEDK